MRRFLASLENVWLVYLYGRIFGTRAQTNFRKPPNFADFQLCLFFLHCFLVSEETSLSFVLN